MEKLELKHYAPRLPYGVKAFDEYSAGEGLYPIFDLLEWLKLDRENWEEITDDEYLTLILRPLSDLTKPIQHKGDEFVPIVEILKEEHHSWYLEKQNTRYDEIEYAINGMKVEAWFSISAGHRSSLHTGFIHNWPLWVVEKLLEWHFDIHGLIEKGLAVDVNTLEVNPYK